MKIFHIFYLLHARELLREILLEALEVRRNGRAYVVVDFLEYIPLVRQT